MFSYAHAQVLVAGNFKDHKMTKSNVETLVADGFRIGDYVVLTKRITLKYGKNQSQRRDCGEGTKASIKGFVPPDGLVLQFEIVTPQNKTVMVDWNVAKTNVRPPSADADVEEASSAKKSKALVKKLPFLENEEECH